MGELEGHITSNPNKVKILEVLNRKKEADLKAIAKSTRIPEKILVTVVDDLKNDEVIQEEGDNLKLTEKGTKLLTDIRSI
ncbi:MAG: winged helix-turn-helix domain-containing protein [Archaeoglobaceae archaeon]